MSFPYKFHVEGGLYLWFIETWESLPGICSFHLCRSNVPVKIEKNNKEYIYEEEGSFVINEFV